MDLYIVRRSFDRVPSPSSRPFSSVTPVLDARIHAPSLYEHHINSHSGERSTVSTVCLQLLLVAVWTSVRLRRASDGETEWMRAGCVDWMWTKSRSYENLPVTNCHVTVAAIGRWLISHRIQSSSRMRRPSGEASGSRTSVVVISADNGIKRGV